MDPEEVMNLFESLWFNLQILKSPSNSETNPLQIFKDPSNPSNFESNPDQRIQENPQKSAKLSTLPTLLIRSKSDQLSSETNFNSDFFSPNSVLSWTPKLQTILSGKVEESSSSSSSSRTEPIEEEPKKSRGGERARRRRGAKSRGLSKSLSELEFEEVKGFINLGFVFSEEDHKDSNLVEIVPGLQRLGKEKEVGGGGGGGEVVVSRPYLSEAWVGWEMRERAKKPLLMNWRIPSLSREIDVKDSLKLWAHTVASTVR